MGVPELWGVITSLSTLIALVGWVRQWWIYRGLAEEAGVFVCEMVTYLAADGEDRVLVTFHFAPPTNPQKFSPNIRE